MLARGGLRDTLLEVRPIRTPHHMTPQEHQDYMAVQDMIRKLHDRIELLESQRIEHRAMIFAAMLCLRDFAKPDQKHLHDAFEFYRKELHQKMLENLEDFSPYLATRMDKRQDTGGA